MTTALQDVKRAKLLALGYTGDTHSMEWSFYKTEGSNTAAFNQAQYLFLAVKGFTVGTLQDRWRAYLLSLGYTGSINDMMMLFWLNYSAGASSFLLLEDATFVLLEDGSKLIL